MLAHHRLRRRRRNGGRWRWRRKRPSVGATTRRTSLPRSIEEAPHRRSVHRGGLPADHAQSAAVGGVVRHGPGRELRRPRRSFLVAGAKGGGQ
jgi:hypothetical protein